MYQSNYRIMRYIIVNLVVFLLILILIYSVPTALAQCDIEEIDRPDGKVAYRVQNSSVRPIVYNNYIQVSINAIKISDQIYLNGILRWRKERKRVQEKMNIVMSNGSAISLPIADRRKMKSGGSNVTGVLFKTDRDILSKLLKSNIDIINLNIDGEWLVLEAKNSIDYLQKEIKCLKTKKDSRKEVVETAKSKLKRLIKYVEDELDANVSINYNTATIESYYAGYEHKVSVFGLDEEAVYADYSQYGQGGVIKLQCKEDNSVDDKYLSFTPRKNCVNVYGSLEKPIENKSEIKIFTDSYMFKPKNAEEVFKKIIYELKR